MTSLALDWPTFEQGPVHAREPGRGSPSRRQVLVVLSSAYAVDLADGGRYRTGYDLKSLSDAVRAIDGAGFEVTFANPYGDMPAMDPASNDRAAFGGSESERSAAASRVVGRLSLRRPLRLSAVYFKGLDEFAGLFVAGGHAALQDLVTDRFLGAIVRSFHDAAKPVAAVGHGVTALIAAMDEPRAFCKALASGDAAAASPDGWPFRGYAVSALPAEVQRGWEAQRLGGRVRFDAEDALRRAGATLELSGDALSEDRGLLTAQGAAGTRRLMATFVDRVRVVRASADGAVRA